MNAQAALVAGMVRHFRLMLTVGTVATLVACGGGGADPAPVPSATPPSITSHPVSQTVQDGQSATFSVSATGDAPLTYQWQRGGADVPWATGTTYTLGNAQMSNDGTFWTARVTNPAGSVVSAGATLSVQAAPASGTVTLFAGDVEQMGTSDGRGSVARFNRPQGLALDAAGNVLVADLLNHTIRKIQPDGLVSTLAGVPGVNGSANGIGGAARFQRPVGVAMGADGLLYVLDGWELFVPLTLAWHSIRTVSPQGQVETPYSWQMTLTPAGIAPGADGDAYATVRNRGVTLFSRGNPPVTLAGRDTGQLEGSGALVRDAAGNIYYSSGNSVQKRAIDGTVTLFAGSVAEAGSADGAGPNARFTFGNSGSIVVAYFAVDAAGNLFVSDSGNHTVRKITPGGVVTTVVGKAGAPGTMLGTLPSARLTLPQGIAVANEKTLYVVSGQAVLKVSLP